MKKYLLVCANDFDEVLDTFVVYTSSVRKAFDEVVFRRDALKRFDSTSFLHWYLMTPRSHCLVGSCNSFDSFCASPMRYYSGKIEFDCRKMPDSSVRFFIKEAIYE